MVITIGNEPAANKILSRQEPVQSCVELFPFAIDSLLHHEGSQQIPSSITSLFLESVYHADLFLLMTILQTTFGRTRPSMLCY